MFASLPFFFFMSFFFWVFARSFFLCFFFLSLFLFVFILHVCVKEEELYSSKQECVKLHNVFNVGRLYKKKSSTTMKVFSLQKCELFV